LWVNLTLSTPARVEDVPPACTKNNLGQIFVRGHVQILSTALTTAGQLIGYLPRAADGTCYCMPAVDNVIVPSTAIVYPSATQDVLGEVCVTRLQFSRTAAADVDLNGIIEQADSLAISNDPQFSGVPANPSRCTGLGRDPCGRADVNKDGKVNSDDTNVVQLSLPQGVSLIPGQNAFCGVVYLTDISCFSKGFNFTGGCRKLSLDAVMYGNSDGTTVAGLPVRRRSFEVLNNEVLVLLEKEKMLEQTLQALETKMDEQTVQMSTTQKQIRSKEHNIAWDVGLSALAVVACGLVVFVAQKRLQRK